MYFEEICFYKLNMKLKCIVYNTNSIYTFESAIYITGRECYNFINLRALK